MKRKNIHLVLVAIIIGILLFIQISLSCFQSTGNAEPAKVVAEDLSTPNELPSPTIEPPTPSPSTTLQEYTPTLDILHDFAGENRFNYGAQVNWTNIDNNQEMIWLSGMGFKWAKAQVRWCDFERSRGNIDYGQTDQLIGAARSKGIRIMFSVVCAPSWSRIINRNVRGLSGPPDNLQDASDFMGKLAGRYCEGTLGAIEVWNEYNLLREWDDKRGISAVLYLDMLKKSYASIKAKCPSIIVVAGAPTPTGVMSDTAIDDVVFLRQMYANGLKGVSDAIGAHPSGFCNAPDASEGMPNPCGGQYNNHRSFFVKRTLEEYRKVMVQNGDSGKQIWPTEFGWGVDPSPKPGYEYERALTDDTQAKWLVGAYQLMKQMGYVGVAILWNLDFTDMGNETGAFHVLGRAAQGALAGMPK